MAITTPITATKILAELGRSGPLKFSDSDARLIIGKPSTTPIFASDFDGATLEIVQLASYSVTNGGAGGSTSRSVQIVLTSGGDHYATRTGQSNVIKPDWVDPASAGIGSSFEALFTVVGTTGGASAAGTIGTWTLIDPFVSASIFASGAFIEAGGNLGLSIRAVGETEILDSCSISINLFREP